jgi:hypothetical protein
MKNISYIILFFFIQNIYAQERKGYLILENGKVENGTIERNFDFFKGSSIRFTPQNKKRSKKYTPKNLQSFVIEDTTYIALTNMGFVQTTNDAAVIQQDFVKILIDDFFPLYEFEYKNQWVWGSTPLSSMYLTKLPNSGQISWLGKDAQEIMPNLANLFAGEKNILEIINQNPLSNIDLKSKLTYLFKTLNQILRDNKD